MPRSRQQSTETISTPGEALYLSPRGDDIRQLTRMRAEAEGPEPVKQAREVDDDDRAMARYQVVNGVAVMTIATPLLSRAPRWLSWWSYERIRNALQVYADDETARAMLIDWASGGGMCEMCAETSDLIAQVATIKPIWSIARDRAFSAAYWLASASSRLIVTPTAEVGSIGVIMTHMSMQAMLEDIGIKMTHIHAGARKADLSPYFDLSPEALAAEQARVNNLYDLFVAGAARNRPISEQQVRETEADIFTASDAVAMGLADEISSYDDTLAFMGSADLSRLFKASGVLSMTMQRTAAQLRSEHPDAVAEIEKAARTEGESAGRASASADVQAQVKAASDKAATDASTRIMSILNSKEAEGREALARKLCSKSMSAEDAIELLAEAPQSSATLEVTGDGDGDAGDDGKGSQGSQLGKLLDKTNPDVKSDSANSEGNNNSTDADSWAKARERRAKRSGAGRRRTA